MVNHKGVQLCKAKGHNIPKTERKCVDVKNRIYTQSRTFRFFPASSLIPNAVAATQIMFDCSTFYFIMAPRARQTTMIAVPQLTKRLEKAISHDI